MRYHVVTPLSYCDITLFGGVMTNQIERLRVGLIGATGRWGPSAHIPAIQNLPETELYAVCTAHKETAQAASEKYDVELAYSDDKTMNENPRVSCSTSSCTF